LADWQISNFIVGHKYRRGAWNLPHKFHLYLILLFYFSKLYLTVSAKVNTLLNRPDGNMGVGVGRQIRDSIIEEVSKMAILVWQWGERERG
jgi:hypothetical protein